MDSLIGSSIGGYTLVSVIGSGGMGTVYLAEDPTIGQQVAIKIVRTDPDSLTDFGAVSLMGERFKQEARAVASLDHLHILPLYRYGEEKTSDGQRAYIIMQYRPEGSLWDWLRRRAEAALGQSFASMTQEQFSSASAQLNGIWPLPLEEAGEYLRQAASALAYAHERGIIHRDVKPANFLLRFESGGPVHLLLSDFGLAKMFASNSATSSVLGTPLYMAPEQFEGAVVPESDQYALAVMIYYFLAGRPPFDGDPMRLMHQHLSAPPPPITQLNPAIPESVGNVLARALAKRPVDRFPTTADFAVAFAQTTRGQQAPAGNMRPFLSLPTLAQDNRAAPGAPYAPYAPTVLNAPPATPQAPQFTPARPAQPVSGGEQTYAQVNSPPPLVLPSIDPLSPPRAFAAPLSAITVSAPPGPPPLQAAPSTLPAKQGMSRRAALGWLLGGAAVAAVAGGAGFFVYSRFHTPDHVLHVLRGHSNAVTSVAWSPDGTLIASGSRDATAKLWQVANEQNTVTYSGHSAAILSVAWNRAGNLLASGGNDQTVQIWNSQGVHQRTFTGLGAPVSSIIWGPDGAVLYAATLGNGGHALSLLSGTITRSIARLNIHAIAFSPDGVYLAAATSDGFVTVVTVKEPRTTALSRRLPGEALCLAWSPDGTKLAAGSSSNVAVVLDFSPGTTLNNQIARRLAHKGAVNGVAWDPAGSARLATACGDGTLNIWDTSSASTSAQATYNGYGPAMLSVAWSSGGLATGDANSTVIVWQA